MLLIQQSIRSAVELARAFWQRHERPDFVDARWPDAYFGVCSPDEFTHASM
jgi:hypothetical protein